MFVVKYLSTTWLVTTSCMPAGTRTMASNSSPFSSNLSLEDIRQMQTKFAAERNWEKYHTPRNLLLAMVGEVGELSELFQWRGEVNSGLPGWTEPERKHLGQELSDVLIYLIRLAEQCHIDLPAAVLDKFKLNAQKYPPIPDQSKLKYSRQEGDGEGARGSDK